MGRKINQTKEAMFMNNATFLDYYNRMRLIATSIFTWKGLDDVGGNSRFLERVLFEDGRAVFVNDPELGYLSVRVNPDDTLNIYELPTKIEAWSLGYHKRFMFDDVVYIMNNELQLPTFTTIELFARRLYETERAIDVNLKNTKTPIIFECDPKTELTMKNVLMKVDGNEPYIIANKDFSIDKKINAINTNAPYLIDKLELHKHNIWDEFLTFIGINNANTDKKERLITAEAESNNDLINYYLNCFYKTRKKACDEINEKFFGGEEKVYIELNKDVIELLKENGLSIMIDEEGAETDEQIYSNDQESNQE